MFLIPPHTYVLRNQAIRILQCDAMRPVYSVSASTENSTSREMFFMRSAQPTRTGTEPFKFRNGMVPTCLVCAYHNKQ